MEQKEIQKAIQEGKSEILHDIRWGHVPKDISSFAELHDYVDANIYGTDNWERSLSDDMNEVQNSLHQWIKYGSFKTDLEEYLQKQEDGFRDTLRGLTDPDLQ